ncbi:MAG: hypothetical protein ABIN96_18335 [Rubrivivax sp.]
MSRTLSTAAAVLVCSMSMAAPLAAHAADALRVVRDPSSGELRAPNAAEAAAFEKAEARLRAQQAAASGAKAGPKPGTEIRYPDGTIETKLGDDTHMTAVVSLADDGSLTEACMPAPEAETWVRARAPASQNVEGK